MIKDTTFMFSKGIEKCSKYLSEYGWVTKCHTERGGDFMGGGFEHIGYSIMDKLVDNPLFGPLAVLGISFIAILGLLVLAWTIAIKGYALWIAAQRKEKWWFIALLVINTIGILEVIYLIFFAKKWRMKKHIADKKEEIIENREEDKEITDNR